MGDSLGVGEHLRCLMSLVVLLRVAGLWSWSIGVEDLAGIEAGHLQFERRRVNFSTDPPRFPSNDVRAEL